MTTAEAGGGEFWEKLPEETSHAYQAFAVYRDQGIVRSLRSAAAAFYAQRGEGGQGEAEGRPKSGASAGQLARFKEWSRKNLWVARVEAFDAHEARERSLRRQKERDRMLDDHEKLARLGVNVLATKLYAILRGEDYVSSGTLPSLITAVTNLHRLTLGEATERVEQTGDQQQEFDYSQLTDDELDLLIKIGDKLYG